MNPLIIGRTGQLARALCAQCPDAASLDRTALDLSSTAQTIGAALDRAYRETSVDGVIIAAAYTAVDRAETEPALAHAVNARGPGIIARWCARHDLPLIHISTDYVFRGNASTPYAPDDPTDPINAYGRSKRAGEIEVLESGAKAVILRTSWVYDALGHNFLTTMLRLAETREDVRVVADQIGRPTFAQDLAAAAIASLGGVCGDRAGGVFHVTNTGTPVSWAGFADAIFARAKLSTRVVPITTADYPTPAARPAYSVLDTTGFESVFDHALPDWQQALDRALSRS